MSLVEKIEHRKITRIDVEGLLGRFDHNIEFDPSQRLLILHGPNGVGKTRLLELIYAAFSRRYSRLARIPFHRAEFHFSDKTKIEVSRTSTDEDPLPLGQPHGHSTRSDSIAKLYLKLIPPSSEPIRHEFVPSLRREDRRHLSRLERDYPIEQIDYDLWLDHTTGEELESYEILERYASLHSLDSSIEEQPIEIQSLLDEHRVHLIETQRLLHSGHRQRRHLRDYQAPQPTVVSYAEVLSQRLGAALAANSRASQELDQSFPGRLFQDMPTPETEKQLRDTYAKQLELRSRLAEVAILDSSDDLDLPVKELEDWERKVLATYLRDAAAKLETFQVLLDRLELFRDIVNDRFLFKRLHFDRDKGFAISHEDSDALLDPRLLSSGEQHELVLMYDLLLNVEEYSLVLIDEPEISLHVAWQKAFLDDLDRVAALTSLRFIIATHSPQIIGTRWDRTVELYSVPHGDA